MKPRLLDLFCGAGGCARGYVEAGFEVVGVDIKPQPRYLLSGASEFHQADALEFCGKHGREFDAIHASPPCQAYCQMRNLWNAKEHPELVEPAQSLIRSFGVPYVIENVVGAPLHDPIMLCGTAFRLGTAEAELRRHRIFEIWPHPVLCPVCDHGWRKRTVGVYGNSGGKSRRQMAKTSKRQNCQGFAHSARSEAMGIDWMTGKELSQAIPPAYTKFIGDRLMEHLLREAA